MVRVREQITVSTVFSTLLLIFFWLVSGDAGISHTWQGTTGNDSPGISYEQGIPLHLNEKNDVYTSHIPLSESDTERQKHAPGLLHRVENRSVLSSSSPIVTHTELPESFDWRNDNGDWTTQVKDQGEECGSCWAYAAVGILESHLKIVSKNPNLSPDLSEQYLLSCDWDDDGCDGGDFETAMAYLVDTPGPDGRIGTVNESVYPVDNIDDSCADLGNATRYKAGHWAYVNASAEDDAEMAIPRVDEIKTAIYLKGPVAAGVDDDDEFDEYEGGIFSSTAPPPEETTNHAVILVGWGHENGTEYFIGKNSFGTEWGEDGWFRIAVNSSRVGEGAVYLDEE